jgi:hypothetical protein
LLLRWQGLADADDVFSGGVHGWPTLASRIIGEALRTHLWLTRQSLRELSAKSRKRALRQVHDHLLAHILRLPRAQGRSNLKMAPRCAAGWGAAELQNSVRMLNPGFRPPSRTGRA